MNDELLEKNITNLYSASDLEQPSEKTDDFILSLARKSVENSSKDENIVSKDYSENENSSNVIDLSSKPKNPKTIFKYSSIISIAASVVICVGVVLKLNLNSSEMLSSSKSDSITELENTRIIDHEPSEEVVLEKKQLKSKDRNYVSNKSTAPQSKRKEFTRNGVGSSNDYNGDSSEGHSLRRDSENITYNAPSPTFPATKPSSTQRVKSEDISAQESQVQKTTGFRAAPEKDISLKAEPQKEITPGTIRQKDKRNESNSINDTDNKPDNTVIELRKIRSEDAIIVSDEKEMDSISSNDEIFYNKVTFDEENALKAIHKKILEKNNIAAEKLLNEHNIKYPDSQIKTLDDIVMYFKSTTYKE